MVIAADAMAVRLLSTRVRNDLVGRRFDDIFDTRIEELLAPTPLARQALWPLRDVQLGRRFFASLHRGAASGSHTQVLIRHAASSSVSSRPTAAAHGVPAAHDASTSGTTSTPRAGPGPAPASRTTPGIPGARITPRSMSLADLSANDPQMSALIRKASRVANSTLPVLIQGPTGSGKECLARALHAASPRATRSFVAVNCAAFPETLIESELFGYGPGAFTGARKEGRKGKIVQSSGGTLFLDEIGDMPLQLQTRLLRVLEEQEVIPLGAETGNTVDLRVVCASNQDLREMIAAGGFRADLYYRLNGITLELPPLAARADKDALIGRLLAEEAGTDDANSIDHEALRCLTSYDWPGNIRELRNVIRSAFAICDAHIIRLGDLPAELRALGQAHPPGPITAGAMATKPGSTTNPLVQAEQSALLTVIRANDGNLCNTARQLGISRNALYRKLKRHGITVNRVDGLNVRPAGPTVA
jgi:sigma-54 dependent transcriptional regulator, acetoin dehydrogenase operon transcriptional activator AcoR